MSVYITILLQFLLITSCILFLFKLRDKLGLAPLYILLGSVQYIQALSGSMVSLEVFDKITIYPASVIMFSAVLVAVLLIYIKEGVSSARALIIGIIISNFIISALFSITHTQEVLALNGIESQYSSAFAINYKYFITGTLILLVDFILLGIIYQLLITKISKLFFFLILFISLFSVLNFDSLVFNLILKIKSENFTMSLLGHVIGKSISAFIFSAILYFYLKYFDLKTEYSSFIANQKRDIFSIIRYQKKYLDLKVEKEKVEKKLVSQLESTLNNISDGFVSLDTNWCYTYVNNKAGEFLGRKPESLIGKHIWTEFPEGVGLPFYDAYYKAVETQETIYFNEYYKPLDRWFENRIYPSDDGLTIYFTDITEKRKAELALKESEDHLRTILNTEPECIKQLNIKGELIYMNPAGLKMIDADNLEMVKGHSLFNLIIMPEHQKAFKNLNAEVFKGHSGRLEFQIKSLKGITRWLETHAVPLKDNEGKIISLLGITRDVTERKRTEEELEKHRNNLEELVKLRTTQLEKEKIKAQSADLMKSAFLATMSHELRTPMNSIIGFTSILLKEYAGALNEEQKKQMLMVRNSGQHLLRLINDILDISKIEAGELVISMITFDYVETMNKSIEFMLPQASDKSLSIILNCKQNQILLKSDQRRVEQIILNLISNAIKFSNNGIINVNIKIKDNYVYTDVVDQGIGISKEDLKKLFKPFVQVNGGLSRSHEGTGLGLAISKNLVEKLGGKISAKSTLKKGSTFSFTLPLNK